MHLSGRGGEIRVWSGSATAIDLCIFDGKDPSWVSKTVPLSRDAHDVWSATTRALAPGTYYALRAQRPDGPEHAFDPDRNLLDPYARGLARTPDGEWRGYVQDGWFDWGGVQKPRIPLDHTVDLRGAREGPHASSTPTSRTSCAAPTPGLAHPSTIAYLKNLGVTTRRAAARAPARQRAAAAASMGLVNYWGYNTLNFFTPHAALRDAARRSSAAPAPCCASSRAWCKLLHEAGLEVVLDVVYNHTAEEGRGGPTTSLRGLDDAQLLPARPPTATTSTSPDAATPSTSRRPPPSGSSSTRCGTGRTRCRSTASGST